MSYWRCADNDTAGHGQWHVHGIRGGRNGYRAARSLQPGRDFLAAGQTNSGARLRRHVRSALVLGAMGAVDHVYACTARETWPTRAGLGLVVEPAVCAHAFVKPLANCRLYGFVDTAYLHGRAAEMVAQQLCEGGADLIQLRAKNSPLDEIRKLAHSIFAVTQKAGVGLVINDHPQIANEIGADLCHLGQEDFFGAGYTHVSQIRTSQSAIEKRSEPWSGAQRTEPPGISSGIGLSTHAPEQAIRALQAQPAYIAIGPVYQTGTKPTAKPVTLEYVRWAAANVNIPWFAIGGINLANLDEVLGAGATRICAVSAILNADDVSAACWAFRARLG